MKHLLYTAFCLLHVSHFAQGRGGTYAVYCRCQNFSIDWDGSLFTDFTFHVIDCFSISSLQLLWSIKKTDTDLSDFQAFTSFTRSTISQIHEFASPWITNRRVNRPIWVCLSLHTICCRPHFVHLYHKKRQKWHCVLLCQYLVLCGMVHFCIVSIVKRV